MTKAFLSCSGLFHYFMFTRTCGNFPSPVCFHHLDARLASHFVTNYMQASRDSLLSFIFSSCPSGLIATFCTFFFLPTLIIFTVVLSCLFVTPLSCQPVLIFTACLSLAVPLCFSISLPPFVTHCVNPLLSTPCNNSPHPALLFCHFGYLF